MSVCVAAQSVRNPLNRMPADMSVRKSRPSGRLLEMIFYRSDGSPFDKSSFIYDANGLKVEIIQHWSSSENMWQNVQKEVCLYLADRVIAETSVWNFSKWENSSKTETFHDSYQRKTHSLSYLRNKENDAWNINPSSKIEWEYDVNGRVVEYRKQFYNNTTNTWETPDVRILYTYTDKGELKDELFQRKNPQTGLWDDGGKYTYNVDQKTATSLIPVNGKWIIDGEMVNRLDIDGNIVRTDYYRNTSRESMSAYCLYHYSDKIDAKNLSDDDIDINVYPNPVVDAFEVSVPETLVGEKIVLFDSFGKPVKTIIVRNRIVKINASGLSGGIYFLRTGNVSKKIIVRSK
jgi:hypothetical protein